MIIGDLRPFESRQDKGVLWENFLIAERLKQQSYSGSLAKGYFWRTIRQQEVDYVNVDADKITGYEVKWNPMSKVRISKSFLNAYNTEIKK